MTTDGINYSECEERFKIYSNDIFLTSVLPKCGSVSGGTQVTLSINIDESTAACLQDLKIGFQAKRVASKASHPNVGQDGKYSQLSVMDSNSQNSGEKQFQADPDQLSSNKKSQESIQNKPSNSIRLKNGASSLEVCDNWVLTEGVY